MDKILVFTYLESVYNQIMATLENLLLVYWPFSIVPLKSTPMLIIAATKAISDHTQNNEEVVVAIPSTGPQVAQTCRLVLLGIL